MMLTKLHWLSGISLLLFAMAVGPACASGLPETVGTFASFSTDSGAPLQFFNGSGIFQTGSSAGSPVAIPVTFQFLDPNSSGLGTNPVSALLTITSTASGTGTSGGSPVGLTSQPMGTTTFNFTTTGNNCVCLLTVTSTGAGLFGITGGKTATLTSSSTSSNIVYDSSQFLNFPSGGQSSYSVSLDSLSSGLKLGSDGVLGSFRSGGTGTFSMQPVPESSTLISFGLMILSGGLVALRRASKRGRNASPGNKASE